MKVERSPLLMHLKFFDNVYKIRGENVGLIAFYHPGPFTPIPTASFKG